LPKSFYDSMIDYLSSARPEGLLLRGRTREASERGNVKDYLSKLPANRPPGVVGKKGNWSKCG